MIESPITSIFLLAMLAIFAPLILRLLRKSNKSGRAKYRKLKF